MTATPINVVTARQVGDYRLHLTFDDGQEQIIDFRPFLSRALHPAIRQWLDPERFSTYRIDYGELVWGDYELCFPVIDLYRNTIEHHQLLESAA
jgi:hypothetical protein